MKKVYLLVLFLLLFSPNSFSRLRLDNAVKQDFVLLLTKVVNLHDAFVNENKEKLSTLIDENRGLIRKIQTRVLSLGSLQQKIHTQKFLSSLSEQLNIIQFDSPFGAESKRSLKRIFSSVLELSHLYNLKSQMKNRIKVSLFYCPLDKTTWFQKGKKVKNPISLHKNCGRKIW